MPCDHHDRQAMDRRSFVKTSLVSTALPIAASVANSVARGSDLPPVVPEIVDTNVHLFEWPFRKLKYARTGALIAKLRSHRITKAWAGSFEAVLSKRLDLVNRRLAEECNSHGDGMLIAIGSVNPAWPDWEEDLRRCHEQYRMPGLRLYPAYHGYTLDHPELVRLLIETARRDVLVQIVLRLEDERVHHRAISIAGVGLSSLPGILAKLPEAKVQLINAAGPLLGDNVAALVKETTIAFDIAATEGNGGVGRLIEGSNYSYRGAIPIERLMFGSHAPYFPCESALMKLFESPLSLDQLQKLMHTNARNLIA